MCNGSSHNSGRAWALDRVIDVAKAVELDPEELDMNIDGVDLRARSDGRQSHRQRWHLWPILRGSVRSGGRVGAAFLGLFPVGWVGGGRGIRQGMAPRQVALNKLFGHTKSSMARIRAGRARCTRSIVQVVALNFGRSGGSKPRPPRTIFPS